MVKTSSFQTQWLGLKIERIFSSNQLLPIGHLNQEWADGSNQAIWVTMVSCSYLGS
uniref:Uncharacterized protein n=1 Tax=Arundo donax TaxID=35708 RepID=A0A0A9GQ87_ARUDO